MPKLTTHIGKSGDPRRFKITIHVDRQPNFDIIRGYIHYDFVIQEFAFSCHFKHITQKAQEMYESGELPSLAKLLQREFGFEEAE